MRTKHSLAISLGIAMLASFTLFACGGKEKKEPAKDAAVEQPQAAEPAKEAPQAAPPGTGTVTDPRNGRTYKTVVIGKQTWMAENLEIFKTKEILDDEEEGIKGETVVKRIGEKIDDSHHQKYGGLFSFSLDSVCPSGWHVPSRAEWEELIAFAGGANAGTALKSKEGWKEGNGTDEFGFNALPGGFAKGDGSCYEHEFYNPCGKAPKTKDVGSAGNWWSSTKATKCDLSNPCKFYDFHIDAKPGVRMDKDGMDEKDYSLYLLSVRCIKG